MTKEQRDIAFDASFCQATVPVQQGTSEEQIEAAFGCETRLIEHKGRLVSVVGTNQRRADAVLWYGGKAFFVVDTAYAVYARSIDYDGWVKSLHEAARQLGAFQ